MNRKTVALGLLLAGAIPLLAVRVKKIEKDTFADFGKGTMESCSLDSRGRLLLGPRIKPLTGPSAEFYFTLAAATSGDVYVGTGHKAIVYRVAAADGKVTPVFTGEEPDVFALAIAANNDLLVGTSPSGRLFRVKPDGKSEAIFDPEEKFIWDVKEDTTGRILLALGNPGGVVSVGKDGGEVETLLTAEDSHIVSLLIARDGTVLAGSGDRGILYSIKNRKVRVLYDSPLDEIRGLAEDETGRIFFTATRSVSPVKGVREIAPVSAQLRKGENEEKTAPKEKTILYCLDTDDSVEQIWSSAEDYAYSLCYVPTIKAVMVACGNSGRVFRVDREGNASLALESESAQVFRIIPAGRGVVAASNNTPTLFRIDDFQSDNGTYYSDVFDAKNPARFGRIAWQADLPKGTSAQLFVRAGNSDSPDASWTGWSAPFLDPEGSVIDLAGLRFLQTKVVLGSATPGETPLLDSYRIYYQETNLRPKVTGVTVGKLEAKREKEPAPAAVATPVKGIPLSWEAEDPNDDTLLFAIYLKRIDGRDWFEVKKKHPGKAFLLDAQLVPDGIYLAKVVADDKTNNSAAQAKTVAAVSPPFVIDSTAPQLRDFSFLTGKYSFTVTDDTSAVVAVAISPDGQEWQPVDPEDRICDEKSERFSVSVPGSKPGQPVYVRVTDEAANTKVYQKD